MGYTPSVSSFTADSFLREGAGFKKYTPSPVGKQLAACAFAW